MFKIFKNKIFKTLTIVLFVFVLGFIFFEAGIITKAQSKGDLHLHTTCSDGKNTYEEMVKKALTLKFDFLAVTDHWLCPEIVKACSEEKRLTCILGQEVTQTRNHVIALGIREEISKRQPLREIVKEIHNQGGLAVAAHPNVKEFKYTNDELTNSGFDAMECSYDIKERRPLPCVFDSDAHEVSNLGWQYNACKGKVNNQEDLKTLIKEGKCFRQMVITLPTVSNLKIKL